VKLYDWERGRQNNTRGEKTKKRMCKERIKKGRGKKYGSKS